MQADKARTLLKKKGVKSGVVNASGDLITWGMQPNGNDGPSVLQILIRSTPLSLSPK